MIRCRAIIKGCNLVQRRQVFVAKAILNAHSPKTQWFNGKVAFVVSAVAIY